MPVENQVSVLLASSIANDSAAPIQNGTNKRKHVGCNGNPATHDPALCSSVPLTRCLDEGEGVPAAEEPCKAPRRTIRAARTATASLVAELAALEATNSCLIDEESTIGIASGGRCDSITSACSALSLEVIPAAAWNDLPDDVLRRILDNLPSYALRIVRSVCRGWWQAINRTMRVARPERLLGSNMPLSFPNLRVLDLSCCDGTLEMISSTDIGLRSSLKDESLAALAGLNRLTELILRGCTQLNGPGLAYLAALPKLEHVDLTGCTGITDTGFAAGLPGLAHVSALTLLNCSSLTDLAIAALTALPKLQRVAVPPKTTDDGLRMLTTAVRVQRVAIRGCSQVGPDGIAALLQAPNLKRVVVSRCPRVTASALGNVAPNLSVVSCAVPPTAQQARLAGGGNGNVALPQGIAALAAGGLPAIAAPDLQLLMATFHN